MKQISDAIEPDNVIFVLDGTIGQAADAHARAFKETVNIGSIVITKMDGHAKGGGAISAVAATNSPIVFIGTGEHIQDLEMFKANTFINKMLGMGDLAGLFESLQDSKIDKEALVKNFVEGKFVFRDFKSQVELISGLGPISKIMGMIPGMSGLSNSSMDELGGIKFKEYITIMNSMSKSELDGDSSSFRKNHSRLRRISVGSGVPVRQVEEFILQAEAVYIY
jgi:signal recognition particle subunit SRP54